MLIFLPFFAFQSLRNQETKKPRNQETKKPRNQETKKPRNQGTNDPMTPGSFPGIIGPRSTGS
jgi:hypothetical protein